MSGSGPLTRVSLLATAALAAPVAIAADAEDYLRQRFYQVELVIFEQSPALTAREGFSPDGIRARERLLGTLRYPRGAFLLAEADDPPDAGLAVGSSGVADATVPFFVSNVVPPAWFAGPCASEFWPAAGVWLQPFERPAPILPDPCLPAPWQVESNGIEMAMHQIVPGPRDLMVETRDSAEEPDVEPNPRQALLDELNLAFESYEDELMASSYLWNRSTPGFATERAALARDYEIIAAGTWHQPVPPREAPQPLVLVVGTMDGSLRYPLEGWLSVTLGRYIHFHANLMLRLSDGGVALFSEQRRMRSDEPHYLDHPAFGILARVDRVPVPNDLLVLVERFEELDD